MFRKIFARDKVQVEEQTEQEVQQRKNDVVCDAEKITNLITEWTQHSGWKFENFADFMELIGINTPARLRRFNQTDMSFKCLTARNREVTISLRFGDFFDSNSEIWVYEGDEIKQFKINSNIEKGKSVPKIISQKRVIKRNGKELESYYCKYFCRWELKIDDTHTLKVENHEQGKGQAKFAKLISRNCDDVESYLLGLDKSFKMSQVYDVIISLLDFPDDEVLISYIENLQEEGQVIARISLIKGEMQEYAIFENGETFHIFKDGSWKYLSDKTKILFCTEHKNIVFSVTGDESDIVKVNPQELMPRVRQKISEMWQFIR